VKRSTKFAQFESTLKPSPIWPSFERIGLTKNMRVGGIDNESDQFSASCRYIIIFLFTSNIIYLYYNIPTRSRN
jgi:hypothetical protein